MPLTRVASFSYKDDTVHFMSIAEGLTFKVERVNLDIARVSFANAEGQETPIPPNIRMEQANGTPNPPVFNSFLIAWMGSYTVYVSDVACLELSNQKQQSISAPRDARTWLRS